MRSSSKPISLGKKWDRQCSFVYSTSTKGRGGHKGKDRRCKNKTGYNYFFCPQHVPKNDLEYRGQGGY